jgi:hypothetical protein
MLSVTAEGEPGGPAAKAERGNIKKAITTSIIFLINVLL